MTNKDEALKMAYKAEETGNLQDLVDAVNALIEALEQPAQEPVAWMTKWENQDGEIKYAVYEEKIGKFDIPLYTHHHQWQGLTDDEIKELIYDTNNYIEYARAIEAKLKEKNT